MREVASVGAAPAAWDYCLDPTKRNPVRKLARVHRYAIQPLSGCARALAGPAPGREVRLQFCSLRNRDLNAIFPYQVSVVWRQLEWTSRTLNLVEHDAWRALDRHPGAWRSTG